jgi:hypothetical protein
MPESCRSQGLIRRPQRRGRLLLEHKYSLHILTMFQFITFFTLLALLCLQITAFPALLPFRRESVDLSRRTDPVFPSSPPSCPICEQNYSSISSCAQAAPVLANFSMIIFNPGAFIDVLKCACADTFQQVYPQCVDCFIKTNQQDVLNTPNLPTIVQDIRNVCGVESAILGNVSATDGYISSTTTNAPAPTSTSLGTETIDAGFRNPVWFIGMAVVLCYLGL